jgi:hypothetical protein
LDGVETRFNQEPRNIGFSNEEAYGVDVFGHGVHFMSRLSLYMMKIALIKWCGMC